MSHLSVLASRIEQRDNDALLHALASVLATPEGREIYRWILVNSHVFAPAPEDGAERWLGWRSLGLYLLDTMRRANLQACHLAEAEGANDDAGVYAELEEARRADERERLALDPISPETSNHKD